MRGSQPRARDCNQPSKFKILSRSPCLVVSGTSVRNYSRFDPNRGWAGGSRSSSTPPSGLKIARTRSARLACFFEVWARVLFRISPASCSIERPFMAARTFGLRFVVSSRFRVIMVAMQSNDCINRLPQPTRGLVVLPPESLSPAPDKTVSMWLIPSYLYGS